MVIEGGVAILAGVLAGSIALVGFGLDSAIECLASLVVIWRFTGARALSETAERRAQKVVAVSFFLLAPYVAVEAVRGLVNGDRPGASSLGIAVTIGSLLVMPYLGVIKRRLGRRLDSGATEGEGAQNLLCAGMAGGVLVGLLANAAVGAWWLDSVVALVIAALAVREGREAWSGEDCCASIPGGSRTTCDDDCGC